MPSRGGVVATQAEAQRSEKAWLLRALLVLQAPRPVFAALRDDSDEAAGARQDTAGAIVWLAGIAGVLATSVAATLMNNPRLDWLDLSVWAFLGGGLYGFGVYLIGGKVLHVALRRLGSRGSFRRARHLLAFAVTPIALALLVYWPIRIAVYGEDLFRGGGSDGGTGGTVFAWVFYGFVAWGLVLLLVGVRTVHGWTWARSLGGVALATGLGVALAFVIGVLYALS
jgi:Yip1 domain